MSTMDLETIGGPNRRCAARTSSCLRRPIVPPIILAKKGVLGGFLHMLK